MCVLNNIFIDAKITRKPVAYKQKLNWFSWAKMFNKIIFINGFEIEFLNSLMDFRSKNFKI